MIAGELSQRAETLKNQRVPYVVATVTRARPPTSAKPGDCALVLADGRIEGFVGGMCAEPSVRLHGLRALEHGEPVVLHIAGDDAQALEDSGTVTVANPCSSGGSVEIFLEPRFPPARIVAVGQTPTAAYLRKLSQALGYEIDTDLVPGSDCAAFVVASHGGEELEPLRGALEAGVSYVGLVASRARGDQLRRELRRAGLGDAKIERLHTPAGLAIGARTPQEIALSILAEVVATSRLEGVGATSLQARHAEAIDPVCGMTVAATESALQVDYQGQSVYFCGERCLSAFEHDPARYDAPR